MTDTVEQQLCRMIAALKKNFPAIQVLYLFGSHAAGTADTDSDVDCAVFVEPSALESDPLYELKVADYLDRKLHRPVDVIIMNKANPILQHEVLRTGQRIYETDHRVRAQYELIAFKRYLDARHFQWERRMWNKNG